MKFIMMPNFINQYATCVAKVSCSDNRVCITNSN